MGADETYDLNRAERAALAGLGPYRSKHHTEYAILHGGARIDEAGITINKDNAIAIAEAFDGVVVERTRNIDWKISEG